MLNIGLYYKHKICQRVYFKLLNVQIDALSLIQKLSFFFNPVRNNKPFLYLTEVGMAVHILLQALSRKIICHACGLEVSFQRIQCFCLAQLLQAQETVSPRMTGSLLTNWEELGVRIGLEILRVRDWIGRYLLYCFNIA